MKFTSKSVTLGEKSKPQSCLIYWPEQFMGYQIEDAVWNQAIREYNKVLDKRSTVTTSIEGIQLDVLKIQRKPPSLYVWIVINDDDLKLIEPYKFSLKGEIVFAENSDSIVDKMVIDSIIYRTFGGPEVKLT